MCSDIIEVHDADSHLIDYPSSPIPIYCATQFSLHPPSEFSQIEELDLENNHFFSTIVFSNFLIIHHSNCLILCDCFVNLKMFTHKKNNFGIVKILIHITFRQDVGLQKQQVTKVFIQKRDK